MNRDKLIELHQKHEELLLEYDPSPNELAALSAAALNALEQAIERAESAEAEVARLQDVLKKVHQYIGKARETPYEYYRYTYIEDGYQILDEAVDSLPKQV